MIPRCSEHYPTKEELQNWKCLSATLNAVRRKRGHKTEWLSASPNVVRPMREWISYFVSWVPMLMGSSVHGFSLVHGCIDACVRGRFGSGIHRNHSDQLFSEQYRHKCKYTEEHAHAHSMHMIWCTNALYDVCLERKFCETTAATTCSKVREEDKYVRAPMDLLIMRVLWSILLREHVQTCAHDH